MNHPRTHPGPCGVLALSLALAGCQGLGGRAVGAPAVDDPGIIIHPGSTPSATGCRLDTTSFQPRHPRTRVPVVLAHGFLRDQWRLADLARALADHGIPAVTLNLCHSHPWDGSHIRNGLDMIAVARRLGAAQVVYGGFSAGGLAALIAGRLDPRVLGVLALDLVDSGRIGVGMARHLDRPLLGLAGAPAACNARNNGRAVFAVSPRGRLTPIPGASHCDFESPTDWLCEAVCSGVDARSPARRRVIIDTAVVMVSDLIGLTGGRHAERRAPRAREVVKVPG